MLRIQYAQGLEGDYHKCQRLNPLYSVGSCGPVSSSCSREALAAHTVPMARADRETTCPLTWPVVFQLKAIGEASGSRLGASKVCYRFTLSPHLHI